MEKGKISSSKKKWGKEWKIKSKTMKGEIKMKQKKA